MKLIFLAIAMLTSFVSHNNEGFTWISPRGGAAPILVDSQDDKGVLRAVDNLRNDAFMVTSQTPALINEPTGGKAVIIGTVDSKYIRQIIDKGIISASELKGKNEKFIITVASNPIDNVSEALIIAGSDKRGATYGIYELSEQMGVSPWYYWADVPVVKNPVVSVKPGVYTMGEPKVKYRGIFLNDEWPSLGNWATETFGDFNHLFYEKLFELILRLKGNFMWPAMWNSAFYDDDPLNGPLANEMGIVMSTSHHEPMAQNQKDWTRRGTGPWDYTQNKKVLQQFWTEGIERAKDWEKVVTVGMRGDGDMAMSRETNTKLLETIIKDQRKIIEKVTGRPAAETPQVWALYKEVQDYYDQGMKVPDDVTLMLCDDNWGNVRKLPALDAAPRAGGYGMYYHFDYVGAPRNSKWINITQVERTWEQMELCYNYGVRQIWVVNVGDFKPMEYPVDFWFRLAWDPESFTVEDIHKHTLAFCAQQFGEKYAEEAARLIDTYTKYNRRMTPELLDDKTFSLTAYDEWARVKEDYDQLSRDALQLYYLLPADRRDAFDQLILYQVQSTANLYDMYYAIAKNKALAAVGDPEANEWAALAQKLYDKDSIITWNYNHVMSGGKWNHMMDQTHIGYFMWQQPEQNIRPRTAKVETPAAALPYVFVEKDGYVSIEAEHFTRSADDGASWTVIPNLGRTLSSVTTWPNTAKPGDGMYLEYDFETTSAGAFVVKTIFGSTLNFNNYAGMRYAVSLDGGRETVVNINEDYRGELAGLQTYHVIEKETTVNAANPGKHTLKIRLLDPAMCLQKIVIATEGGLKKSLLGPQETLKVNYGEPATVPMASPFGMFRRPMGGGQAPAAGQAPQGQRPQGQAPAGQRPQGQQGQRPQGGQPNPTNLRAR